jgi:hypothetical protein
VAEDQAFAQLATDAFGENIVLDFCHNLLIPGIKSAITASELYPNCIGSVSIPDCKPEHRPVTRRRFTGALQL